LEVSSVKRTKAGGESSESSHLPRHTSNSCSTNEANFQQMKVVAGVCRRGGYMRDAWPGAFEQTKPISGGCRPHPRVTELGVELDLFGGFVLRYGGCGA
jgi:hypothetical protein